MDPNAAWAEMCDALKEGNRDIAMECAMALHAWLRTGGFAPRGVNGAFALDVVRTVISAYRALSQPADESR